MKLNEKALGLTAGILAAVCNLLWMGGMGGWMRGGMMAQGPMYGGGVLGIVYAFIVFGIAGYVFAWLYNRIAARS